MVVWAGGETSGVRCNLYPSTEETETEGLKVQSSLCYITGLRPVLLQIKTLSQSNKIKTFKEGDSSVGKNTIMVQA